MTRLPPDHLAAERHLGGRAAWLRAAVLGANDAFITTASLMVGVAAADSSRSAILVAGIAGLTAGALSMAAGEYVSVRDACSSGDPAHDPAGGVAVEPMPVGLDGDRSFEAVPDRQVDRSGDPWRQRHGGELAALAQDGQGAMATFQAKGVDAGADRFGDAQTVQRQQRHEGVVSWRRQPGAHEDGAELVAVEMVDVGLVIDAGGGGCAPPASGR